MFSIEDRNRRHSVERFEKWMQWIHKIPFLKFPCNYEIKIIPPFGGAIIRFWIRSPKMAQSENVSVYLDGHDVLGCVGEPYWEIYPYSKDDPTARYLLNETDQLMNGIKIAVKNMEKANRVCKK